MDITRELISLIVGVFVLIAMTTFFLSMSQVPTTEVSHEKYQASEDIGRMVASCCRKHAGSYKTYNDDCEMHDIDINGNVTEDMISWYVPEECQFNMSDDIITGKGKIKITYLGREKRVKVTVF